MTKEFSNIGGENTPSPADEQIKQIELESKRLELEIKKQELEAAQLQIEERRYSIRDLKARLADRDIEEKQAQEDREQQGRTFAQQEATDKHRWANCTHRKGGAVSQRDQKVLFFGGDAAQHAIMKHQMITGDIWVRCLRCGRTWKPPIKQEFFVNAKGKVVAPADGVFDKAKFDEAVADYKRALMFPTNNSTSSSVLCKFATFDADGNPIDAADKYREIVSASNLR